MSEQNSFDAYNPAEVNHVLLKNALEIIATIYPDNAEEMLQRQMDLKIWDEMSPDAIKGAAMWLDVVVKAIHQRCRDPKFTAEQSQVLSQMRNLVAMFEVAAIKQWERRVGNEEFPWPDTIDHLDDIFNGDSNANPSIDDSAR